MTDYRNPGSEAKPKVPTLWVTEEEAKAGPQLCRQCAYPMEERVSAAGKLYWACKRLPTCTTHVMISTFAKKRPGEFAVCVAPVYGNPDGHVNAPAVLPLPPPPPASKIARLSPDAPHDEPLSDVLRGCALLQSKLDTLRSLAQHIETDIRQLAVVLEETRADPAVRAATFVSRQ